MERQPNRLVHETSPYLLQHAHNPVDWWPWGEAAFADARERDVPVFLSIGYSACHWCHVMERESFEDESVAELLNGNFVSIKVDREERPDVDSIYMQAVQMMTGHGGWPMSVFLTPEGVPFFGGTYFPPEDRHGLPSFRTVLTQLAEAWHVRRGEIFTASGEIRKAIAAATESSFAPAEVTLDDLNAAARHIASGYDATWGGFGSAPKFPPSMTLSFLMQVAHRTRDGQLGAIVTHTLDRMAYGGIYDQIGGGFHRYSTDARWLAPHFEKMLYDNALLARLYVRAWQWTKEPLYARIARETLAFVEREMTAPEGGFYSTLDADSEGVEGKFYVWSRDDVLEALGEDDGRIFAAAFDVSERGNWEGVNILHLPRELDAVAADVGVSPDRLAEIVRNGKAALARARDTRIRPGRDEKVLAAWNGWMLAAFAEAALAFDSEDFRDRAIRTADFLLERMIVDGKLRRSWKAGEPRIDALLEDYGGVIWGLIAAFEASQRRAYLDRARALAREAIARFGDRDDGGFWDSASDGEVLITRPRDVFDNATPSGNSLLIASLLRLGVFFDDAELARRAELALRSLWTVAKRYPSGFGFLLGEAAEWVSGTPREIAVTGPPEDTRTRTLIQVVGESFVSARVLAASPAGDLPLLEGKPAGRIAAWVCEHYHCLEPVDDPEELRALLEES